MEKREKDKRENIKDELVKAAAKKAEEEAKKRYNFGYVQHKCPLIVTI